ncbi:superfamily I DNA and RNA helicases [Zymobacter palmae]|uniref:Superfamily I DNA and RNA helicases n=1 Tax=Zymobacter palmae TaxID=33074 RepID=A0A348HE91_9GAMM|nr:superfamily I DNA and RNA helicases [Zymobacter palmae]
MGLASCKDQVIAGFQDVVVNLQSALNDVDLFPAWVPM